ncbi:metallophosphoesterase [Sedimentisphaera salicampi]|uniref:Calcineurin-like phosphoesterase domain-containing protein n=1 Tax=Sedimentisphaera salicampi TaxID=1941349 RepID=A0A1W6LPB9_9BACT|nr:metallophosphoesterase [Sedimentisphaera salicampi]ARN57638.1 hypothetical protein STSP1_02059 [Sedimentisphaera salicampi]
MHKSAQQYIASFKEACALNRHQAVRDGNIIKLPEKGRVIVAGDLHGYDPAFDKIKKYADLENNPDTHLVIQEIVHGGPKDASGGGLSFRLLKKVCDLKTAFPENVHMILSNHDCSTITGSDVLKAGEEMRKRFEKGLQNTFSEQWEDVLLAIKQLLFYQSIAVRTENGFFISHSLPMERFKDEFEQDVFSRPLLISDMNRPNSVYSLTWGKKHSTEFLTELAKKLNTKFFILGHQNYPEGYLISPPNAVIITTEHSSGCICELDLAREYQFSEVVESVKRLNDL